MANEVEKIDFGNGEVFEIPKPNNAEIVIKQGGVEKGRFTVNASEPVEIDLDSGYKKPISGIPKSDLDRYVQESLEKADTALQNHQDISGKVDRTSNSTQFIKSERADTVVCFQSSVEDYSWIGFRNNAGSNIGWFGASKDKKPFFYGNSAKQLALKDDIPTYSASTGLNLSGTAFSVKYGTAAGTACQGNDSRLSDSRNAKDVYSWAKASSKPSYGWSEITSKPALVSIGYAKGANLNNLGEGIFECNTACSNLPVANTLTTVISFYLDGNSNFQHQIAFCGINCNCYTRSKWSGTWQGWTKRF